ncbi:hypothetical protein ABEB36_009142 [Hypothenemus hampei]|uniref:Uncharacterized protein n=1 Tax=Hypothenemus hampei TaxID=57062 RepID=A0ABD1EPA9_HYPHA
MECEENAGNCGNVEASASTNSTNTNKKIVFYKSNAIGPYIVFIETQIGSSSNLGNFTHFKIAKEIFKLKLDNSIKYEIKGKNRLFVQFKSADAANEFCKNKILLGKGYNIYIPYNRLFTKRTIKSIPDFLRAEEVQDVIESRFKIESITRLNRKIYDPNSKSASFKSTSTIMLPLFSYFTNSHDECLVAPNGRTTTFFIDEVSKNSSDNTTTNSDPEVNVNDCSSQPSCAAASIIIADSSSPLQLLASMSPEALMALKYSIYT